MLFILFGCSDSKETKPEDNYDRGYTDGYIDARNELKSKLEEEISHRYDSTFSDTVTRLFGLINTYKIHKDSIKDNLYIINTAFKPEEMGHSYSRYVVSDKIETYFRFLKQDRENVYSLFKKIGYFNRDKNWTNGFPEKFIIQDIISVDDYSSLCVFREQYGWGTTNYCYAKLIPQDDYYIVKMLFKNMDITGIGRIQFIDFKKISDTDFYLIGHNTGEGHESISLHLFSDHNKNITHEIVKCSPSMEADPNDEKLEYTYDKKADHLSIKVYMINHDKESEWRLKDEVECDLLEVIEELRFPLLTSYSD